MRPMNLLERFKRWWAPGEYDDERGESDGEGFAVPGEQVHNTGANELVHGQFKLPDPPRDE
jgi:hypothetical protein